jgi:hypothetical protein
MRSRRTVTAVLGLQFVGPRQTMLPLVATLFYSCEDPYAVRVTFHADQQEPVEWILGRDLLSTGIKGREGIGDVTVWPSAGVGTGTPGSVLNIKICSSSGRAHMLASVREISDFLGHTYEIVPAGAESRYIDTEAELIELLRQASLRRLRPCPGAVRRRSVRRLADGAGAGPAAPAARRPGRACRRQCLEGRSRRSGPGVRR